MGKLLNTLKTIGGPIVGAGLGLLTGKIAGDYERKKQIEQQRELQDLQVKGQMQMGKFNQGLAMDMWNQTNYEAQRKHMENAGLNVGLMYGQAGQGGTTNTPTGNVTGGTASGASPINTGMGMQIGLQAAMQKAQIENLEANTEKTKVEAAKTAGVDTQATGAQTLNAKVQNQILEYEKQLKAIELSIQHESQQEIINRIKQEADKAKGEAESAAAKGEIDQTTKGELIKQIAMKGTQMAIEMEANKAGIVNTKTQTQKIAAEINNMSVQQAQNWISLDQAAKELWIKEQQLYLNQLDTEYRTGTGADAKQWVSVIEGILKAIIMKK